MIRFEVGLTLVVHVEVEAQNSDEARRKAIGKLGSLTEDQLVRAIERAQEIGRMYPLDVAEIMDVKP